MTKKERFAKLKAESKDMSDFAKRARKENLTASMSQGRRIWHSIKEEPKHVPMCWKCASAITTEREDCIGKDLLNENTLLTNDRGTVRSKDFVGCSENREIQNYEDAKIMCPLIKKVENE